jgi:hypothetical protein
MDMPVTKQAGDRSTYCWVSDLSPSGVKLLRTSRGIDERELCKLELHLVPGAVTTVLAARRVWRDEDFEAYEFIDPSFSQQVFLERMVGNL